MMYNPPALPNTRSTPFDSALLPWEDRDAFAELHAGLHDEHNPSGPTETSLVDRLVWIEWRRRRLLVGERAAHMASVQERLSADYKIHESLSRALIGRADRAEKDELKDGISRPESEDARELIDADEDEALTLRSLAILEAGGAAAYQRALDALREDTVGWWNDILTDDAANYPEAEGDDAEIEEDASQSDEQPYRADAASLERFLRTMVLPVFAVTRAHVSRRPSIRLQVQGESLDPFRLDRMYALDERLARQFEKALSMLIRLQEMRLGDRKA